MFEGATHLVALASKGSNVIFQGGFPLCLDGAVLLILSDLEIIAVGTLTTSEIAIDHNDLKMSPYLVVCDQ